MKKATIFLLVILALAGSARDDAITDFYAAAEEFHRGNYDAAIHYYTQAIHSGELSDSDRATALNNRGGMYNIKGQYDRAIADYDRAIDSGDLSVEDQAITLNNRGNVYYHKGEYDRAIHDYDRAIRLKPDYAHAYSNRGLTYYLKGEYNRAIGDHDQAIWLDAFDPDNFTNKAVAQNGKAWKLATSSSAYERDGVAAVRLAREAIRLKDEPTYRVTLAAAFAEAEQFDNAVAEQQRAIEMLWAAGQHDQVADYQTRLDLYLNRQPYRE